MTKMSRILCVVLAFAMVLAFAACGKNGAANSEVAKFVQENESELIATFEDAFEESSGLEADCTVSAKGNSIAYKVCLDGIDNVPAEAKTQMQDAFDSIQGEFAAMLGDVKEELGSIESVIVDVCEEDGDFLASIEAKF